MKFRIYRPGAGVVSWHRTLKAAVRALARQERGARMQGGYSQDRVELFDGREWWTAQEEEIASA